LTVGVDSENVRMLLREAHAIIADAKPLLAIQVL